MYKQNQNITLVAKDGSATQIIIYQAKKSFASTNHFDFDNIKSPPPKTKIKNIGRKKLLVSLLNVEIHVLNFVT